MPAINYHRDNNTATARLPVQERGSPVGANAMDVPCISQHPMLPMTLDMPDEGTR